MLEVAGGILIALAVIILVPLGLFMIFAIIGRTMLAIEEAFEPADKWIDTQTSRIPWYFKSPWTVIPTIYGSLLIFLLIVEKT